MKVVADRGDIRKAPENTMAAFRIAVDGGADALKLDVHSTVEGELVIYQDFYLGRTSTGTGAIFERSFEFLNKLDAGSWYDPSFAGAKILKLRDVLEEFKSRVSFEIELRGFGLDFIASMGKLINDLALWEKIEFTAPMSSMIVKFKDFFPNSRTGLIVEVPGTKMDLKIFGKILLDNLIFGKINVAHLPRALLSQEIVSTLRNFSVQTHASKCNDTEHVKLAVMLGLDQLSTENLDETIRVLGRSSKARKV